MALEFTRSGAKDWAKAKIKGFYMCPISPVGDDFNFDYKQLRENIDQFIDMGIEGLVVGGFIAECWNVPLREWLKYHQVVAEAARGRIPLWTIILDPSVHQALEKLDYVEKLGFEGAEVINPVVQLRTDDEIFDWFQYLTDHTNLAICLYRTGVGGRVLGFDLMRRLAGLDTVVAVKQGAGGRVDTLRIRREHGADQEADDQPRRQPAGRAVHQLQVPGQGGLQGQGALRMAVEADPRAAGQMPSTKGTL